MRKIRIANGVEQAYFSRNPAFAAQKKATGRRLAGLRYEKQAQAHLRELSPTYLDAPWLRFQDANGWHWCQPDGIHFDFARGVLTVVEIKYQHTPDAWVQLLELYAPVLLHLFPASVWRFQYLEMVKWLDPDLPAPKGLKMVAAPFQQTFEKGVHIWK